MTTNNEQQVAGLTSGLNVELDPTSDELEIMRCLNLLRLMR